MSSWFIFLFVYNFLQIFTFLFVWSLLLFAVFRISFHFIFNNCPNYGLTFAVSVSTLLSSALLFELLHQYHLVYSQTFQSPTWLNAIFPSFSRSDNNWFGPIWRLNPFYIAISLLTELLVVISAACGRSMGEYVSGLFRNGLIAGVASVLMTLALVSISLFAYLGCKINIGIQGITISRSALEQRVNRFDVTSFRKES